MVLIGQEMYIIRIKFLCDFKLFWYKDTEIYTPNYHKIVNKHHSHSLHLWSAKIDVYHTTFSAFSNKIYAKEQMLLFGCTNEQITTLSLFLRTPDWIYWGMPTDYQLSWRDLKVYWILRHHCFQLQFHSSTLAQTIFPLTTGTRITKFGIVDFFWLRCTITEMDQWEKLFLLSRWS